LDGFKLSTTYYNIHYTNRIQSPPFAQFMTSDTNFALYSKYAKVINNTGCVQGDPSTYDPSRQPREARVRPYLIEPSADSHALYLIGFDETIEERIEHLERVRAQQDKSKGFTAFIAWTFQSQNTRLNAPMAGGHEYLRQQALNRIYLDNFRNIQSSWVTQGPSIGQVALKFGANDLGSIMIEENVVSQAGASFHLEVSDMHRLIRELGYTPSKRDNWYRLLD